MRVKRITGNKLSWALVNSWQNILWVFLGGSTVVVFFLLVDMTVAHVNPLNFFEWRGLWEHNTGPAGFCLTAIVAAAFIVFLLVAIMRLAITQLFAYFRK